MPEKVTVTISASSAHPDVLTIEDAMRQVLDIFDLLAAGDTAVEWRLSSATTNSPLHIEAEAVSFEPAVDITVVARAQKQVVADGLREIADGHIPDTWDDKRVKIAKRLYERNLNGIGSTDIDFQQSGKIKVTPKFAQSAVSVLAKSPKADLYEFPRNRGEIGSIEGVFAHLSTYRNQPAIGVVETRTKSIVWCVLSPELQAKFADKADFEDFWRHRRVIVRGRIRYSANRAITQVVADDISRIEPKAVALTAIKDTEFTSGLSTGEYLERFRDGALGG
ncbi:hypothetical protein [Bradyrhizobium sp. SZCCHNR1075]|uniref:hypothetical protein n=2 Tax=Bradyrhizobium TaxID=374 RepID=UPI0028E57887|nr:hypothetical protein [Bradyrhizobium sp. SZCCHNR1075]